MLSLEPLTSNLDQFVPALQTFQVTRLLDSDEVRALFADFGGGFRQRRLADRR